ncbi:hypothetical protein [Nocardia sp. CC227C]|uniref:hypothetical protein n=1 Tax=Nocardia sp. CC227C TaxID=3044562 RepID=UPI00278BC9FF|nr:hypothetical protein [Nocardia sp. CC227C]
MNVRTGLFVFPGGVLEYQERPRRVPMRSRPTAIGYLRTDVSGTARLRDQREIRRVAARLGYDFADMIVYDPSFGRPPLARLKAQATRLDAEAVIVPGPEHFDGGRVPESLVERLDVITVRPEQTYARCAVPPDPDSPDAADPAQHSPASL